MEDDRWILSKLLQILSCTIRSWHPDMPVVVKDCEWWRNRDSCLSSRIFQNCFMSTWHCSQLCTEHGKRQLFLVETSFAALFSFYFNADHRMLIREEKRGEEKLAVPKPLWNRCSLLLALPCLLPSILFYNSILYVKSSLTFWTQGMFSSLNLICSGYFWDSIYFCLLIFS